MFHHQSNMDHRFFAVLNKSVIPFLRFNIWFEFVLRFLCTKYEGSDYRQILSNASQSHQKEQSEVKFGNPTTSCPCTIGKQKLVEHDDVVVTVVLLFSFMEACNLLFQNILYCKVGYSECANCSPEGPRWVQAEVVIEYVHSLCKNGGLP